MTDKQEQQIREAVMKVVGVYCPIMRPLPTEEEVDAWSSEVADKVIDEIGPM